MHVGLLAATLCLGLESGIASSFAQEEKPAATKEEAKSADEKPADEKAADEKPADAKSEEKSDDAPPAPEGTTVAAPTTEMRTESTNVPAEPAAPPETPAPAPL